MSSWTDFKSSTLKYINSMGGVEVRIQRNAPPILGRAQLAVNIIKSCFPCSKSWETPILLKKSAIFPSLSTVTYCLQHAFMVSCSFQGLKQLRGFRAWRSNRRSQCKSLVDLSSLDRWIRIPMTPRFLVGLSLWHIRYGFQTTDPNLSSVGWLFLMLKNWI